VSVSVIIVSWNTRALLCQCLDSLAGGIAKVGGEIFVVDNGSIDGSREAVREHFPGVKLIENASNCGFARANNQALKIARGDYVLLLNPDTRMKEGSLEEMLLFMKGHPEAGAGGAQLLNGDGSKQNSIANFPSLATELLSKSLLKRLFPKAFPGKERDYRDPIEVDSVIGACMMVRREAMEDVGVLDESYFLFMEETDWCYRMKKGGWKIYHLPRAEVFHFQGKSAESQRAKAKIEYYRSRYIFFKKNRGRAQWAVLLVGGVLKLGVELIAAAGICILTLFRLKKWRKRLSILATLVWWHLRFCPEEMGLKPVTAKSLGH
jgi:GT2 family glycosyltransferase